MLPDIKVLEKGSCKEVYINGVKQEGVLDISVFVTPTDITEINLRYNAKKFEIIREDYHVLPN